MFLAQAKNLKGRGEAATHRRDDSGDSSVIDDQERELLEKRKDQLWDDEINSVSSNMKRFKNN